MEVTFRVDSLPGGTGIDYPLQVDLYVGDRAGDGAEGKIYLGSVEYVEAEAQTWVTKSFVPRVSPSVLGLIVATATDANGNTSEFSTHYVGKDIVVNTEGDEADADPGDGICAVAGGGCTLRAALQTANAGAGGDIIVFDIPGAETPVIEVGSALPSLNEPVCIDGTTQPGSERVVIKGEGAAPGTDGLTLTGGNSTLRGVAVAGFRGYQVVLQAGDDNLIEGCYIGTVWGTTDPLGLPDDGIHITGGSARNVIGGVDPSSANVIADHWGDGIEIDGADSIDNRILNNYIGTDAADAVVLGNQGHGVRISASSGNLIQGNVISNNGERSVTACGGVGGISISGSEATDNVVRDNRIGTNGAGDGCLANQAAAVRIEEGIRTQVSENVISCNLGAGVCIERGAENAVFANFIGTNAAGDAALGNDVGVFLMDGQDNVIGAESDPSDLQSGNLIAGNGSSGVRIVGRAATGNRVFGNYIGTDVTGAAALGNLADGISISDASGNWIGTVGSQEAGNLIAGNSGDGISIFGKKATGNRVRDNIVGLNASADTSLPNKEHGIFLFEARNNLIEGNVVAGNGENGIELFWAIENQVYRNYVGTNAASATGLGNGKYGILLDASSGNEIGGSGRGNVVGNNQVHGIRTDSGRGRHNHLVHNWVGIGPDGTSIPNLNYGIHYAHADSTLCANKIWYNGKDVDDYGLYDSGYNTMICANSIWYNQGIGLRGRVAILRANSVQHSLGAHGVKVDARAAQVFENHIVDNAGMGLYYDGFLQGVLLAENNWWGAANGPGGEGPGDGDEVSLDVDYEPWLTEPIDVVIIPETDLLYAPRNTSSSRVQATQQASVSNWLFFQNWATMGDTLTVTVSDTRGWLVSPATFTVTLEDALGASRLVSFTVPADTSLQTTSEVMVSAVSHADPSASDTETFQVVASLAADLAVTVEGPALATEAPFDYTISVHNDGPDPATGVVLTNTLPVTVTFVSAGASQGSCVGASGTTSVICQLGTLTSGAQATVTVKAGLTSTIDTMVVNVVEVQGSEYDMASVNNFDAVHTPVGKVIYLPLILR